MRGGVGCERSVRVWTMTSDACDLQYFVLDLTLALVWDRTDNLHVPVHVLSSTISQLAKCRLTV